MKTPDVSQSATIKLALTRKEAAAALGVSPVTIDRLTQRGILKPSRATRRPLYAITELERFLNETRLKSFCDLPTAAASPAGLQWDNTNQTEGKACESRGASAPFRQ